MARTVAQQLNPEVEKATAPFQFALTTRCGGECVAHAIQAMTDIDPRATVLSVDGVGAGRGLDDAEPAEAAHGWQRPVLSASEECFWRGAVWPRLSLGDRALLRSQNGPLSGVPFTSSPAEFRVLFLRRLWLPLPLTSRVCRCGRPLDSCGHHRAACSRAGVLGSRGDVLESAAARVCREAGGRVSTNVFLRDMALHTVQADGRRLEVVVDGLPLFRGAQLAIDTTLVSPLRGDGQPQRRCVDVDGAALDEARRRKERTYPELC